MENKIKNIMSKEQLNKKFREEMKEIEDYHCNECNKRMKKYEMNDLEIQELENENSFVCSDCINREMTTEFNLNEKDFQDCFYNLNITKFGNKLPNYKIKFRKMRIFGNINYKKKMIHLNPNYPETIKNTLLHEMTHADLNRRGFKNKSHSIKFWREFVDKGGKITEANKKGYSKVRQVTSEKNLQKEN